MKNKAYNVKKLTLNFSLWIEFIGPQSVYEVISSKINFFVFQFRSLQKRFYYAKGPWQKIFHLKSFFVYYIKFELYLVKNICFLIFSQGARWIFLILHILELPYLLFSYSIGILSGHPKFDMFFVLTSVQTIKNPLPSISSITFWGLQ